MKRGIRMKKNYIDLRNEFINTFEYYKKIIPLNELNVDYDFDYDTIFECYNDAVTYCKAWHLLED